MKHITELSKNETIVLMSLAKYSRYSLEIQDTVRVASNGKYSVRISALYVYLSRLKDKGLITSNNDYYNGRERPFYEPTEEGRAAIKQVKDFYDKLADYV